MAGIKITDLSALSVAESGDYLCIVDVSDTSQSPAGTTKKIELQNAKPYKSYVALLTQSGTDAPTAIVLENTLTGTPSFSYISVGIYTINLTGEFIEDKTFFIIGCGDNNFGSGAFIISQDTLGRPNSIYISTGTSASSATWANNLLYKTPIEIRVYN